MSDQDTILFVSAAEGNVSVLTEFLDERGCHALPATSLDAFDRALDAHTLDLVLIDADGLPSDVWARCEQLQRESVPFFVISRHGDAAGEKGREHAATHVFEKPVGRRALVETIRQVPNDE